MRAEVFSWKVAPDQRLDLNCRLRTPDIGIVTAQKLGDDRLIDIFLNPAIGHELEVERDGLWVAASFNQGLKTVITHMDVRKLIDICHPDPIGLSDQRMPT